jgi:16S rRNA processing protein RimM
VEPADSWDDMVLVGFVARTHGIRGHVIVKSETDFPDARFKEGATLFARRENEPVEALLIRSVRFHQGRPILGIEGIGSIDEAERLAGAELKVPASEQEPLPEGAYYHHELIGCQVITRGGAAIGKVASIDGGGEASRLVVRSGRGEVLIPLADEICAVDVAAKTIVVTPPAGLLEVNGEWRE